MAPASLHQVLTACGIRDISATIEGSREKITVIKAALQMLHGGVSETHRLALLSVSCFWQLAVTLRDTMCGRRCDHRADVI